MSAPQVFISYARSSTLGDARSLKDALTGAGITVFLDEAGIPPGGRFPPHIADALLGAKLMIIFADEAYFTRPWCIYEFRVAMAPFRTTGDDTLGSAGYLVIALPSNGSVDKITAHLPPALREGSWLKTSQTLELAKLVQQRLALLEITLGTRLEGLPDDAVRSLRSGALVPAATRAHPGPTCVTGMPLSLKERFIGRAEALWQVFHALESRASEEASRACVIQGGPGMGKTQLAAEFAARYGLGHFPGGLVWIHGDGGDEDLAAQWRDVYLEFAPVRAEAEHELEAMKASGAAASDQMAALARRLRGLFQKHQGAVLWIVDNVPEPAPNRPACGLSYFCPVREFVSVLGTSRVAGIKDADDTVSLNELEVEGAIELLTQPKVNPAWLPAEDWQRVVRWVGCWPLGLQTLHASLSDGFLTAASLCAKASGAEPAAALDAEVELWRGEIEEGYVRGVAEVYRVSYDALADKPETRHGLHCLARLAPFTFGEDLLCELIPSRHLGVLAHRSWIQPASGATGDRARHWVMHRVCASYLRGRSTKRETGEEFATVVRWFSRLFQSNRAPDQLLTLQPAIRVTTLAFDRWLVANPESDARIPALELGVTLAKWRLGDKKVDGLHFIAAQFTDAIGGAAELMAQLRPGFPEVEEASARAIVRIAGGLATSPEAAAFLVQAFSDPRDMVRWSAYVDALNSGRSDLITTPLFLAYLREANESVLRNGAPGLEVHLRAGPAVVRPLLSHLARSLFEADAPHRRFIAEVLGRILYIYGDKLEAGGFRSNHVRQPLCQLALSDPDESVALGAASALGMEGSLHAYGLLCAALSDVPKTEAAADSLRRVLRALCAHIESLERPGRPSVRIIEEDGKLLSPEVQFGSDGTRRPELFTPVVALALETSSADVRAEVVAALLKMTSGKLALVEGVTNLVDQGHFAAVILVAEAAMPLAPDFASPYWWRGQARAGLQQHAEAVEDFGRVVKLVPHYPEALVARARSLACLGRIEDALKDVTEALTIIPDDVYSTELRTWLLTQKNV